MKKRVYYFNDKAGKAGHFETRRKGSNFDWRITTEEAARLLFVHGDNLPFDIMAKNYGINDEDDTAWSGLCKDDLSEETADALAPLTLDEDWGPFEIFRTPQADGEKMDREQDPFTMERLDEDGDGGVLSFDCKYCGQSFLDRADAIRHFEKDHAPGFKTMAEFFKPLTDTEFSQLWAGFVSRRVPKKEKTEAYFERIRVRDIFAKEVKRRGL